MYDKEWIWNKTVCCEMNFGSRCRKQMSHGKRTVAVKGEQKRGVREGGEVEDRGEGGGKGRVEEEEEGREKRRRGRRRKKVWPSRRGRYGDSSIKGETVQCCEGFKRGS